MATINAGNPTLLDLVKRTDPNGSISRVVELLRQNTPFLDDMAWQEGNLPTGHKFTMRDNLPALTYRRLNEGVASTKSKTDQVTETCAEIAGRSNVDVALAALSGNAAAFRASEDAAFVQAFRHELEAGLFYNSSKTNPEKFQGLAPRFDVTTNAGGNQILLHDSGASGNDQTSIWLVGWSPETVFGIFPQGSTGGLFSKDMGEVYVPDGGGTNWFRAYSTDWKWNVGLCVRDWRYVVRIANVDTGNLAATGSALIVSMIKAIEEKMQDVSSVRPAFYVNRKIASYLRLQAMDSTKNSTLTIENVAGKPITMFSGIPVRRTDALLNTEAVVA